jgi:hypothetical protein
VLRSRKNEGAPALFVHEPLHVGEEVRHPLDFIQNGTVSTFQPAEKGTGIFCGLLPVLDVFQGDVMEFRKGRTGQGSLARLPGPGQKDHWERADQLIEAI